MLNTLKGLGFSPGLQMLAAAMLAAGSKSTDPAYGNIKGSMLDPRLEGHDAHDPLLPKGRTIAINLHGLSNNHGAGHLASAVHPVEAGTHHRDEVGGSLFAFGVTDGQSDSRIVHAAHHDDPAYEIGYIDDRTPKQRRRQPNLVPILMVATDDTDNITEAVITQSAMITAMSQPIACYGHRCL